MGASMASVTSVPASAQNCCTMGVVSISLTVALLLVIVTPMSRILLPAGKPSPQPLGTSSS